MQLSGEFLTGGIMCRAREECRCNFGSEFALLQKWLSLGHWVSL